MVMLGWVTEGEGKRAKPKATQLLGLPLWKLELPVPGRSWEKRAAKGLRLLAAQRVTRVLTAPDCPHWSMLRQYGFRPVETRALRGALLPDWVARVMAARGIEPRRAVVCLRGGRETPDMERSAHRLCPLVRGLIIDVPGGGELAARLRREYGVPILPAGSVWADLTIRFEEGPVLEGAAFAWKGHPMPQDCEVLPLLSALWECGRVKREDIAILV